jgi:hypothetical protein
MRSHEDTAAGAIWIAGSRVGAADWRATLVLLHGIDGDPAHTWGKDNRWCQRIAQEYQGLSVVSLDVKLRRRWRHTEEFIEQRAAACLEMLFANKILDCHVIFFCYSLGGIILKRMISDIGGHRHSAYFAPRQINIRGIVFLGVPHRGSDWAHSSLRFLLGRLSSAAQDLAPNSRILLDTDSRFRNVFRSMGHVRMLSVQETKSPRLAEFHPLLGWTSVFNCVPEFSLVVSQMSATAGCDREEILPVKSSHLSLATFDYEDADSVIKILISFILDCIAPPSLSEDDLYLI